MVKLLFEALVAIGRRQLAGESLIFFFNSSLVGSGVGWEVGVFKSFWWVLFIFHRSRSLGLFRDRANDHIGSAPEAFLTTALKDAFILLVIDFPSVSSFSSADVLHSVTFGKLVA